MKKIVNNLWRQKIFCLFTIYLRYVLGASFIYAFGWKVSDGMLNSSATPMNIANNPVWEAFACIMQIKYWWFFSVWLQLIAGVLLVTQRFALLGAIFFSPLILSICLITWSIDFIGTKYIALLMLIANSYLLIWDYKRLMPIIKYKQKFIDLNRNNIQAGKLWEYGGIALALVSLLRIVYNIFLFWFITCILIGVAVFIFDKVGSKTTMEDVKR